MELNIKFNTESEADLLATEAIGAAIQAAMAVIREKTNSKTVVEETTDEKNKEASPEVEEQPKKRAPRRKKEEAAPVEEPAPTPASIEEEQPSDDEPEETAETPAPPSFPTMTKDEFTVINKAKREALGLTVDGEHADLIRDFNAFCQKWADLTYGNPKPSTLPAEQLWSFAQWFQNIQLNPDYIPGSTDEEHGNPFVSIAPSKD